MQQGMKIEENVATCIHLYFIGIMQTFNIYFP